MIAESSFATIFGATVAGGDDSLVHLAKAAVRAGFAIVACHPGTKQPMCTLSAREIKAADEHARAEAYEAGHRRWDAVRHACGVHHALTDVKVADRVIRRLVRNHGRINLGVELHRSRVVIVDVDTERENAAFRQTWHEATGEILRGGFTVATPGVEGDDPENWKHKHGGHYWFIVPEGITLPRADGVYKDPSGWTMMWADRQVLVPPSVRPEGAYRLVGEPHEMPKWLLVKLLSYCVERKRHREAQEKRKAERLATGDAEAAIDVWSADTPWAELLEPDGWYDTTVPDNCGCPIWTAPGVHASPKSATAHEPGCSRYDDSPGHAPLHVWTDNPPEWLAVGGDKTFTKIQYLANRDHEGNIAAACRSVDIAREGGQARELQALSALSSAQAAAIAPNTTLAVNADPLPMPSVSSEPALRASNTLSPLTGALMNGKSETGSTPEPTEQPQPEKVWFFADEFDQMPTRIALIEGIILVNSYIRIIGKSNHGKSFLAVDLAGHIATGSPWHGHGIRQGRVAYIAAEDPEGIMMRVRAWEHRHRTSLGKNFLLRIDGVQVSENDAWAQLIADMKGYLPSIIFFDTQAASTYGIKENDNDEAGFMNQQMKMLHQETGATVALIHHKGHTGEHGRGASSVQGALDTEISIETVEGQGGVDDDGGATQVEVTCIKQKNWQKFAPIKAEIVSEPETGSAVLVTQDPLSASVGASTASSGGVRERIARYVYDMGNGLGGISLKEVRTALAQTRTRRNGIHHVKIARQWEKFIEHGQLIDAATGYVVVNETEGETMETVLASPTRRVVLAPGLVQELGFGNTDET